MDVSTHAAPMSALASSVRQMERRLSRCRSADCFGKSDQSGTICSLKFISLDTNDPLLRMLIAAVFNAMVTLRQYPSTATPLLRLQFLLQLDKAPTSEHNSAQVLSKLLLLLLWEPQTRPPFRLNISDTAESEAVP